MGVAFVEPARPGLFIPHQAGGLEHPQVLRYGRPADRQPGRQLADGLGPGAQAFEDGEPRRVAQRFQTALNVSIHLP